MTELSDAEFMDRVKKLQEGPLVISHHEFLSKLALIKGSTLTAEELSRAEKMTRKYNLRNVADRLFGEEHTNKHFNPQV